MTPMSLRVLAEAATRLSPRLPYEQLLSALAQLPVPLVGDWAMVDIVEQTDDGRKLHRVVSSAADPQHEASLWDIEANPPLWCGRDPVLDVIQTGNSLFAPEVTDAWLERQYSDEATRKSLHRLNVQSLIVLPLIGESGSLGALTIGTVGPRVATEETFGLARLIAERGSPSIEAAQLYRSSQRSTAARDALLGTVSHDLIGVLGSISMYARSLTGAHRLEPTRADQLCQNILGGAAVMHRLLLDLVDISAIEAHRLSVSPGRELLAPIFASVGEVFTSKAAAANITIEINPVDDIPEVWTDRTRLIQVLTNLLDNAIKYTPAGGNVSLSAHANGREVIVCVRDTGCGLDADEIKHVFEHFWRGKSARGSRGFGLGMAIVKGIVTALGGRIWLDSAPSRGTMVCFTVARAGGIAPARAVTPSDAKPVHA
jgi:signal transduction histidine kinase